MLTHKQQQLLLFIHERMIDCGVPPSFEEMKAALDLKSKSGIHRLITGLEERGFLRRLPHKARALEVLRMPENHSSNTPVSFSAHNNTHTSYGALAGDRKQASNDNVLPLLGHIAAGNPILAHRDDSQLIDVPAHMIGRGDHYVLIVDGESMIGEGIHNGDYVVVQQSDIAKNGEIVVALVDGKDVTLKRWRKLHGTVALEPANPSFETQLLEESRVSVQGIMRGLMRVYH